MLLVLLPTLIKLLSGDLNSISGRAVNNQDMNVQQRAAGLFARMLADNAELQQSALVQLSNPGM